MGLKQALIDAKVKAAKESGVPEPLDTSPGSFIEREAEYTKEAIVNFITEANFTITQLKAPVIVEDMKTPDQAVNVKLETLLGDKAPILKTLKQIGGKIPGAGSVVNKLVDKLESSIAQAVKPLLKGGSTLPGLNLNKGGGKGFGGFSDLEGDGGILECTGYVYIGEDPDSQDGFDVEDENGQREFTTVKLFREDIEKLL
tara:strand:+ start:32 stop:631 length:600 start_codon:yes stop_codon:yes gene_type:complete